jgi:hypothetical protein
LFDLGEGTGDADAGAAVGDDKDGGDMDPFLGSRGYGE